MMVDGSAMCWKQRSHQTLPDMPSHSLTTIRMNTRPLHIQKDTHGQDLPLTPPDPPWRLRCSVTSTNKKSSQPMLQSSGSSHSIDWLNAILPGPVKLGWACLGSRCQFWFPGLVLCWCTITEGEQPTRKQKSCRGHRLTLPNKAPMRTTACNAWSHSQSIEPGVSLWRKIWGSEFLLSEPSCLAVASNVDNIFRSKSSLMCINSGLYGNSL